MKQTTTITITSAASRPRPRAGDTRRTKLHGLQIRVRCMARNMAGRPIGRLVSNGRPVYGWRKPRELDPWDQHLLQRPEIAAELKKDTDA